MTLNGMGIYGQIRRHWDREPLSSAEPPLPVEISLPPLPKKPSFSLPVKSVMASLN